MSVQLTIHQPGTAQQDFFRPARRYEFEQMPVLLGADACSCPIPGAPETLLCISSKKNTFILECLTGAGLVEFRGRPLAKGEKQLLHSGDSFTACGSQVNFFLNYPRRGVSWQSNALAWLAKSGILLILMVQIFSIFILPERLKNGRFWSGQQMRLNIIAQTDQLRKQLNSMDNPDPLARLLIKEVQQELLQRTAYLRMNSEVLTRSQRKTMLQALSDLQECIRFLEKAGIVSKLPPLEIDRPVAQIIEKAHHE